jgi:hypothetical protein
MKKILFLSYLLNFNYSNKTYKEDLFETNNERNNSLVNFLINFNDYHNIIGEILGGFFDTLLNVIKNKIVELNDLAIREINSFVSPLMEDSFFKILINKTKNKDIENQINEEKKRKNQIKQLKKQNRKIFKLVKNFDGSIYNNIQIIFYLFNKIIKIESISDIYVLLSNYLENYEYINISINKYKNLINTLNFLRETYIRNNLNGDDNREILQLIEEKKNEFNKKLEEAYVKNNEIFTKIINETLIQNLKTEPNNIPYQDIEKEIISICNNIYIKNNDLYKLNKENIEDEINNHFDIFNIVELKNTIDEEDFKNIFSDYLDRIFADWEINENNCKELHLKKNNSLKIIQELIIYIKKEKESEEYINYMKDYNKIMKILKRYNLQYSTNTNKKNFDLFKTSSKKNNIKKLSHMRTLIGNSKNQEDKYLQFKKLFEDIGKNNHKISIQDHIKKNYEYIIEKIK